MNIIQFSEKDFYKIYNFLYFVIKNPNKKEFEYLRIAINSLMHKKRSPFKEWAFDFFTDVKKSQDGIFLNIHKIEIDSGLDIIPAMPDIKIPEVSISIVEFLKKMNFLKKNINKEDDIHNSIEFLVNAIELDILYSSEEYKNAAWEG